MLEICLTILGVPSERERCMVDDAPHSVHWVVHSFGRMPDGARI